MDLEFELENFEQLQAQMDPNLVKRALTVTMSRTARRARTVINKEVRKRYNIRASEVSRRSSVYGVRTYESKGANSPVYVIHYSGRRIGLLNFDARIVRTFKAGGYDETVYKSERSRDGKRNLSAKYKRGKRLSRKKQVGISVEVIRGQRKTLGRENGILPFVATGQNGVPHIFRRLSYKRQPLTRLETVSVPKMVEVVEADKLVNAMVATAAPIEFDRAMRHLVGGDAG